MERRVFGFIWAHPVLAGFGVFAIYELSMLLFLTAGMSVMLSTAACYVAAVVLCVGVLRAWGLYSYAVSPKLSGQVIVIFVIASCVVWGTGTLAATWIGTVVSPHGAFDYNQVMDSLGFTYILIAVLGAPVIEELVFRGVLFGGLAQTRMPAVAAAAVSSALFALAHGTAVHLVPTFLLGMLNCLAYERSRRVWLPMALHCIYNVLSVVATAAEVALPSVLVSAPVVSVTCVIVLTLVVVGFAWVAQDDDGGDALSLVEADVCFEDFDKLGDGCDVPSEP